MVKVGVIGAGFMGTMHSQCYSLVPGAKLIGIADIREEKTKELAKKFNCLAYEEAEKLLKNPELDAVDICLPTFMHKEWVIKAADAGKDILCEKPIALNLSDADEMIEATQKAKVRFMVAQVIRFWPEYIKLKEIFDKKELGNLLSLSFSRLSSTPTWGWKDWLTDPEKSGSALIDLHIHDTDYILYLLGKPNSIFSSGTKVKGGYTHIFSTFKYPEGITIFTEGGWDFINNFPFTMAFTALFEEGVVEFNTRYEKPFAIYKEGKVDYPVLGEDIPRVTDTSGNISELGGYYNEIKYFVECVQEKKKPDIVTPEEARNSLALVLKEMESADKGEKICVS